MEVFSLYFITVKPYILLFLCFYRICFAAKYIFQRFIKSQRGFSNAGAGAGYPFYPHSTKNRYPIPITEDDRVERIHDVQCSN